MIESRWSRLVGLARQVGPVGPLVVVVLVGWAWDGGGFSPGSWSIVGIGLVLLLAIVLMFDRSVRAEALDPAHRWLLTLLWAFAGWNFLSLTWADFPGEAWTGANKTLVYAVVFSAISLMVWRTRVALVLFALFSLGVTAVGAIVLFQATSSTDAESFFQDGRLLPPIGYVNANPALWMIAFWPAAFIGSLRGVPTALRALFLGCATVLLSLALLGESRGWLFVLPVTAALALLFARQRLRLILAMALPAAGALVVLQPMVDVYTASENDRPLGPPLDRAAAIVVVAAVVVAAAGLVWGVVDRRSALPRRLHRGAGYGVGALGVCAVGAAAALLLLAIRDDPRGWLDRNWSDFTRGYSVDSGGGSRFVGSLGTDRYLQWRVAITQFRDAPIVGAGSDNYAADYTLQRRTDYVDPRFPHSTPLRLLGQLGIVGTGLFAAFVGIAVALTLRRRRTLDAEGGGVAGLCLTVFAYWFVHGSIDWFWEIPGLAAAAFACLAIGASRTSTTTARRPASAAGARRRVLGLLGLVAVVVVVASLGAQWLSFRYQMAGLTVWRSDPREAYARLDRAAQLNPLSAEPRVIAGSIALSVNDLERAKAELEDAIEREPRNWYAYFQLALAAGVEGRYDEGSRLLRSARELNPRDSILRSVTQSMRRRETIDPAAINALYLKELNRRLSGNPRL